MKLAAAILLVVLPLHAQLAHKGRTREQTKAAPQTHIRKLPRRTKAPTGRPTPPRPDPAPPRPLSEDRLRPQLKGTISPLSPQSAATRQLPREIFAVRRASGLPGVEATAITNRWMIFPAAPWRTNLLDPYNRNRLKGDYPIVGRKLFFAVTAVNETTFETRRLPVPSVASASDPGQYDFFGRGRQFAVQQNFRLSFDLFRGSAAFKPIDFEIKITPAFNINRLVTRENGLAYIDASRGTARTDSNISMQEAFAEKRLWSGKAFFDFASVRAGIQRFTSDFRGLVFSDEQPGARLFGTLHNNVFQYNLAYFNMLEKDTNSGLNRWRSRRQQVYAANLFWSDFLTKGYTLNISTLYNHDQATLHIDKNGFLVRPAPAGVPVPHKVRAGYAGIAGEGHIQRINVSHAFYQAFGQDAQQHINAQLAALELGYEKDWMEWKASVFYTSGDSKLNDDRANGFDGIVPNQQFAGGGFLGLSSPNAGGTNFLNREPIPLTGTGLTLFGPNSLMPTMRAGLFQGQANFANPGVLLFNAGFNAKITPKIKTTINANWAKFNRTEVLETLLFQSRIHHAIGLDTGIGVQYRPLLSDNVVVTAGVGTLFPGAGFKDIYTGRTLFSTFVNLRMVF